jgi:hypothetical protein
MIQSRPIEIDGRFVGVAVRSSSAWHFVAVDPVLEDLHGMSFPSVEEAGRIARLVRLRERRPPPGLPRLEDVLPA